LGRIVLIGIGGMLGAILRYLIGAQAQDYFRSVTFPFGTLVVNALGCLMIGVLSYFVESRGALTAETRMLLMTGLLGAFTTFSSFSLETVNLISSGQLVAGLANIAANNVLGLAAVWVGRVTPFLIWR
jgi:fluoride exporter